MGHTVASWSVFFDSWWRESGLKPRPGTSSYVLDQCLSPPRCIKWVPKNSMQGVTLQWTSISSRKETVQGRSQGGSWGACDLPFVSLFVSKQPIIFRPDTVDCIYLWTHSCNMFSRDVKRLIFRCQTFKFSRPTVKVYFSTLFKGKMILINKKGRNYKKGVPLSTICRIKWKNLSRIILSQKLGEDQGAISKIIN